MEKKTTATENSSVSVKEKSKNSERKKKDLLSTLPPELEALGVTDVGTIPPPRPVLWGQNLEADSGKDLNTDFVSTEKDVVDGFEDVPLVSIDFTPSEKEESQMTKKKEASDDDDALLCEDPWDGFEEK